MWSNEDWKNKNIQNNRVKWIENLSHINNIGRKHSEETKLEIGLKLKGINRGKHFSIKTEIKKGQHHSPVTEWKKGDPRISGTNNCNWKGGISTNKDYLWRLRRDYELRKLNAEGYHTRGEWELLKKQYGFKCPACQRKEPEIELTEDHIIPLFKGGSDWIENIQPLCRGCNSTKRLKTTKYALEIKIEA